MDSKLTIKLECSINGGPRTEQHPPSALIPKKKQNTNHHNTPNKQSKQNFTPSRKVDHLEVKAARMEPGHPLHGRWRITRVNLLLTDNGRSGVGGGR